MSDCVVYVSYPIGVEEIIASFVWVCKRASRAVVPARVARGE